MATHAQPAVDWNKKTRAYLLRLCKDGDADHRKGLAPWTIKAIAIRMNRKFWPKIREEHGPYKWEHISYELNEHGKYYRRKYWQVINDENALLAEGC
jgi:hypothetical protein